MKAQKDMRLAYGSGATGVLASGIIWCLAGFVGIFSSQTASMVCLFVGGMLIFPLSIMFSKLINCSGKHSTTSPLRHLAIENLGILFGGLFIAFVMAQFNSGLFYPVMLLVIGARYLTFQTLYGLKSYWVLGCLLMVSGFGLSIFSMPFTTGAFLGGAIEIVFSFVIYRMGKNVVSAAV